MSTPTTPPLQGTVTVSVPVEHAFRMFTDSIHTWWRPSPPQGLHMVELDRFDLQAMPTLVRPHVLGVAERPR
jgi:hypothetical protein